MRIVSSEKDSLLEAKNGCHSTFQMLFNGGILTWCLNIMSN